MQLLEMAARRPYDLVVLDMQVPRLDGLEATRHLWQLAGYDQVPVVALTSDAFAEDRAQAIATGMDDWVAKPVAPDALFRAYLKGLSGDRA